MCSFSDFTPFGGWTQPTIKQYAGDATKCGVGVDLNYRSGPNPPPTTNAAAATTTRPPTSATTSTKPPSGTGSGGSSPSGVRHLKSRTYTYTQTTHTVHLHT